MTYDQWKTTDPRDYAPQEEREQTELEYALEQLRDTQRDMQDNARTAAARIMDLQNALIEALKYFQNKYDVKDGPEGAQLPNEEMRLGTMIDEVLYDIKF